MKPFDLKAALDGANLVTKNGNPARLVCADKKGRARFIWLEQDEKCSEYVATGTYEALCQALRLADDEPVKQAQTPRPHAELIKAWADGAEIEAMLKGEWTSVDNPLWLATREYRIKPKEWYETIPEHGVLCWVSDYDMGNKTSTAIVYRYNPLSGTFGSKNTAWKYATPLTNDEIKQFLR